MTPNPYMREALAEAAKGLGQTSPNPSVGAIVVRDGWQRKGIGTLLLGQLVRIAHEGGLAHLRADLLADNHPMRRLLYGLGLRSTTTNYRGELSWVARLPPHIPGEIIRPLLQPAQAD